MAGAQSRRKSVNSPCTPSGLRVDGALLQLMRVLVDIAGNASSTLSDELVHRHPAVPGDERWGATVPAADPQSRLTQSAGCSATDSQLVQSHGTSRDASLRPAGTEQD